MPKPPKQNAPLAFRELLEVMPDVQAWMKDREGRYLWVNTAFLMNYGLTRLSQVVGKADRNLSPAHLAAHFEAGDQAVLSGRPVNHRLELVGRYDHSAHWCRTTKLPARDARGRSVGTVGFTRRLTAAEIGQMAEIPLGSVIATMIRRLGEKITSGEMARAAGTSVRGLERAFDRDYGLSPACLHVSISAVCACRPPASCSFRPVHLWRRSRTVAASRIRAISNEISKG
jgi:PAS domain S-box-containing protein